MNDLQDMSEDNVALMVRCHSTVVSGTYRKSLPVPFSITPTCARAPHNHSYLSAR